MAPLCLFMAFLYELILTGYSFNSLHCVECFWYIASTTSKFASADFLKNFSHNILEIGVHGIRCFKAYSPFGPFFNCFAFIKEMSTSYMLPICVTTKLCIELLPLFLWRTLIGPVTFWTTWKQMFFLWWIFLSNSDLKTLQFSFLARF